MKKMNRLTAWSIILAGGFGALSGQAGGGADHLEPFQVIGSRERVYELPGSGSYVEEETIRTFNYDNIDQVIRRVPGVYFRTEDGYGLFPNISVRGIGSMRTSNVTVMEDGILSAPAPYSNPAAYYTPTTGRMSGLEVLKGSSQIRFGPQITGGVINYLSTPIPMDQQGYARLSYGSEGDFRGHAWQGGTVDTEAGRLGYLLELYYRETSGFKRIDGTEAVNPERNTGFRNFEPMVKLSFEPKTDRYQRWEFKAGYSDLVANETYLGLSTSDFAADPLRRYASSRFDIIPTEHWRTYLNYQIELNPDTVFSATAYYNKFTRAWYKLNDLVNNSPSGNNNTAFTFTNLSEILAGGETDGSLDALRGRAAGNLRVRNNNREYQSYGVQTTLRRSFQTGDWRHRLEGGLRFHNDYEFRFQNQDIYEQAANGAITSLSRGAPGSQDNRKGVTDAVALYIKDRMEMGPWSIEPGVRYERLRYENDDRRPGRSKSTARMNVWGYGSGLTYAISPDLGLVAGYHRGFAVPGPGAATGGIMDERSDAFEAGIRYRNLAQAFSMEAILFHTDFKDLIVPDNVGGSGVGAGQTENVGRARTQGLELGVAWDPAQAGDLGFRNPWNLALTWSSGRLRSDASAGGSGGGAVESIFAGAVSGNRLPQLPTYQLSLGTGLEYERWGFYADSFWVGSSYGTASNTDTEMRPDGRPDARFGKNDSYFLLDFSAHYRISERVKLMGGVNNALDREYIASRLPHGPRPGQPRFWHAGMEFQF